MSSHLQITTNSQNSSPPLCLQKRSSKIPMFVQMGQSRTPLMFVCEELNIPWLAVATQVPSIIDPTHICLFIGVTARVDLFKPWRLRTLKKIQLHQWGKKDRAKLLLPLLFFLQGSTQRTCMRLFFECSAFLPHSHQKPTLPLVCALDQRHRWRSGRASQVAPQWLSGCKLSVYRCIYLSFYFHFSI